MSLSRESLGGGRQNVIKHGLLPSKLKISEYRSVLEEIQADRRNVVTVDVDDLVGKVQLSDEAARGKTLDHEGQEIVKDAVDEAFDRGFEAGKTEARRFLQDEYDRKVREAVGGFAGMVNELHSEIAKYDQDFDRAILTLSLAIAKRIVAREIEIDEHAVLGRSREAIRKIIGVDKIKIHINPSDEEYIREHRSELSAYADSVKEIVIEADNKVERGGCIIESELGNIDARVSTQFELIEEALLGLVKQ
jgi:flagellar assembly protein FliH